MTPVGLLGLVPLFVAGFVLVFVGYRTRFVASAAEGQKLFFVCATAGLCLGAMSFPLFGLMTTDVFRGQIASAYAFAPKEVGPLALAIVLGAVIGILSNVEFLFRRIAHRGRIRFESTWHFAFHWLATCQGTPLQQLLGNAASAEDALVMVTLTSRKIYCGTVLRLPPIFKADDQYIEIIPMYSAHRDKDTLALCGRLDYPVFDYWRTLRWSDQLGDLLKALERHIGVKAPEIDIELVREERLRVDEALKTYRDRDSEHYLDRFNIQDWAKVIPMKMVETVSMYDESANRQWFMQAKKEDKLQGCRSDGLSRSSD